MHLDEVNTEPGLVRRLWRDAFAPIGDSDGFYRHRVLVRLTHWINALCILFLLGSGLNIFNAHPRLYWGKYGADSDQSFFSLDAVDMEIIPSRSTWMSWPGEYGKCCMAIARTVI